ncbi:hypothetical protein JTE90_006442, partial [Oedothorax gibbosus]
MCAFRSERAGDGSLQQSPLTGVLPKVECEAHSC